MRFFKALIKDIKINTSSTYLKVALLAVTLVPLLYGALYLKAFWDPYAKIDNIPVAVVNLDSGNDNDPKYNIGNELVEKLKKNDNLKWNFVSETEANDGLNSKKYYASITIPEDFSKKIYSVDSDNPQKATIIYKSRESTNYIATTITSRISNEVANSLSSEIISKYFNNIFVNIRDTSSDLKKASDGAGELQIGLASAASGNLKIESGLHDAINGNHSITNGLNEIYNNQSTLTDGLSKAASATNTLKDGSSEISSSQDKLKNGLNDLSNALTKVESATTQIQAGLSAAEQIINNYIAAHPESASELTAASQTLTATNGGLTQASSGINQINTKTKEAADAVGAINVGQSKITAGLSTLNQSLVSAQNGSSKLTSGSYELITGSNKLTLGLNSLSSGVGTLQSGLITAENGSSELKNKLASGANKAAESSSEQKASAETPVMSSPISVKNNSYDTVANYGSGLTPYFISLGLWVGGIMTFFVIDFEKKPKKKSDILTKYAMLCIIGLVQSIVLDTILICCLGLNVENPWQFYGFTILVSLSFMAILQLFIHNLGNIGRYIAIILLVLQLTSAAGTFPKETLPAFFQIINPLLPMTYSISGIRDIVFTNELSNLVGPVLYFIGMIVISLFVNFLILYKRTGKFSKKVV